MHSFKHNKFFVFELSVVKTLSRTNREAGSIEYSDPEDPYNKGCSSEKWELNSGPFDIPPVVVLCFVFLSRIQYQGKIN